MANNNTSSDIRFDRDRLDRCGFPEFIFGEGKSISQILEMAASILDAGQTLFATRLSHDAANALAEKFPKGEWDEVAKTFLLLTNDTEPPRGNVLVVTAGSSDIPVAREAKNTLTACGCGASILADAGVAGLHRIIEEAETLRHVDAVVVVAGMEGALPSVVGGLTGVPIIAVPTSVGYGAALGGLTAMFSMLNSCANGVTVVNVDNGFGAGCAAARIVLTKKHIPIP